ncbi:MAG: GTP 3',8-cyclase MoaA [Gammaproteobacteria bacterium]|nr:GTP 3',8-cyclase MoaA [Gammaproteobacteria bacterium]
MNIPIPIPLTDQYARQISYLRISVTDRCDFRCIYCMGEDIKFAPRKDILTLEELYQVATAFVKLGVRKIRITGGEPLVRKNIVWLLEKLGRLSMLEELVLTSNGSQLETLAAPIRTAGVNRLNISLDSLDPIRFKKMTRVGDLDKVLRGIHAAQQQDFNAIKINSVIMRNHNDDEILPLAQFAVDNGFDISYIEEMPMGAMGNHRRDISFYSSDEVRDTLTNRFSLLASEETTGGPSRYYHVQGTQTRIGFISPYSHNFCDSCNRVRLTAQGRLLLCLGQEHSVDLRQVLRGTEGVAGLFRHISQGMAIKPQGHEFSRNQPFAVQRHMNVTGG